jgi:D-beta-D-heptose 7-phosphate kinase/D-beta-D-heptose 1-phosphate adenosyltransferase
MNVIVIGDIMIDLNHFSNQNNKRAAEADIPIYEIESQTMILGGAANVAFNLKKLECNTEIISVVGNDDNGNKYLPSLFETENINYKLFKDSSRKTTVKNRVFFNNSIVQRYDYESTHDITFDIENEIFNYILSKKDNLNAIVISDYNKGVITRRLCIQIIDYCNSNNIYSFVDPKINYYLKYAHCFCFKPNLIEAMTISNLHSSTNNLNNEMFDFINENIQSKYIVITCGENGIIYNYDNTIHYVQHSSKIEVIDVTGAGDIVLAILVFIFLKTQNISIACRTANFIAGKSVQCIGNYKTSLKDIEEWNQIEEINVFRIKNPSSKIIFTNGCFDILHSAHLKLLSFAKKQGNMLIVGLNSDESIKRLKGENRPINDVNERKECLLSLGFIDHVIVFYEDTPLNIIKQIKPNIIIKGGDYKKEDIIGIEYVDDVILFDYINNKSTSLIIDKIKNKLINI